MKKNVFCAETLLHLLRARCPPSRTSVSERPQPRTIVHGISIVEAPYPSYHRCGFQPKPNPQFRGGVYRFSFSRYGRPGQRKLFCLFRPLFIIALRRIVDVNFSTLAHVAVIGDEHGRSKRQGTSCAAHESSDQHE